MKFKVLACAFAAQIFFNQNGVAMDGDWRTTTGSYAATDNPMYEQAANQGDTVIDINEGAGPGQPVAVVFNIINQAAANQLARATVDHHGLWRDIIPGSLTAEVVTALMRKYYGASQMSLATSAGEPYFLAKALVAPILHAARHTAQQYGQVALRNNVPYFQTREQSAKWAAFIASQLFYGGIVLVAELAANRAAMDVINQQNAQQSPDGRRRLQEMQDTTGVLDQIVGYNWQQYVYLVNNIRAEEHPDGLSLTTPAFNYKDRAGSLVFVPSRSYKIPFGVESSSDRPVRISAWGDEINPAALETPTRIESDSDRTWILSGIHSQQTVSGADGIIRKNQTLFYVPHNVRTSFTDVMRPIAGKVSDFHPGQIYMWGVNANQDIFKCQQPCNGNWQWVPGKADRVYVGQDFAPNTRTTNRGPGTVFVKTYGGAYYKRPENGSNAVGGDGNGWKQVYYWDIPLPAQKKLSPPIPNNDADLSGVEVTQTSTLYNCKIKPLSAKGTDLVLTENSYTGDYELKPDWNLAEQLFRIDWVASQDQNGGWADSVKIRSSFNENSCLAPRGSGYGWPEDNVRRVSNNTCRGDKELYWAVNYIGYEWSNAWSDGEVGAHFFSVRATQNEDRHWDMRGGGNAFNGQKLMQYRYNNDRNQQFWIYGCRNEAGRNVWFVDQRAWN